MSIPMAVAGEIVVVMIMMRAVVAEMVAAVAKKSMPGKTTPKTVTAPAPAPAAFGRGVDLREDDCEQDGPKDGDGFSQ